MCIPNAHSQSLAPDGDFDLNINGWHCGSVNPIWVSDDGSEISGNGSLQMSVQNITSNGGQLGGGTCDWVSVTPELDYLFNGFYKVPTDSEFENLLIQYYWFTETEDFISVDTRMIPTNTITRDTWVNFDHLTSAPADATKLSISLVFQFYADGEQGVSAFLGWDDLFLKTFIDEIYRNGFE